MSLLSQVGTLILIVFVILVIKESNKQVEKAAQEGEYFEDEWAQYLKMKEKIRKEEKEVFQFEKEVEIRLESENIFKLHQAPSKKVVFVLMDDQHYPARRVEIKSLPFNIGRGKENHLVLDDLCVAREHCQLIEKSGNLLLKDRGSMNKIYADGRLHDEIKLYDRQRFYIGNEEFLVEIDSEEDYGKKSIHVGAC